MQWGLGSPPRDAKRRGCAFLPLLLHRFTALLLYRPLFIPNRPQNQAGPDPGIQPRQEIQGPSPGLRSTPGDPGSDSLATASECTALRTGRHADRPMAVTTNRSTSLSKVLQCSSYAAMRTTPHTCVLFLSSNQLLLGSRRRPATDPGDTRCQRTARLRPHMWRIQCQVWSGVLILVSHLSSVCCESIKLAVGAGVMVIWHRRGGLSPLCTTALRGSRHATPGAAGS